MPPPPHPFLITDVMPDYIGGHVTYALNHGVISSGYGDKIKYWEILTGEKFICSQSLGLWRIQVNERLISY